MCATPMCNNSYFSHKLTLLDLGFAHLWEKELLSHMRCTFMVKLVVEVLHIYGKRLCLRDVSRKKTGQCGNFSQVGDPPPLPPV